MPKFLINVVFPLDNDWVATDGKVKAHIEDHGYTIYGSGAGFGERDIDCGPFDTKESAEVFLEAIKSEIPEVTGGEVIDDWKVIDDLTDH